MYNKKIPQIILIVLGLFLLNSNVFSQLTLIQPANNSNCVQQNPTLTWSKISNAVKYDLFLSTSASFNVDSTLTKLGMTDTTIVMFDAIGNFLNSNTNYYWKIRATLSNDLIVNSVAFSFHTYTNSVSLVYPINDLCCLDLAINFKVKTDYSKIDTLRIVISKNRAFTQKVKDTVIYNPTIGNMETNTLINVPLNSQDYWWVAFQKVSGCWSDTIPGQAQHFCTKLGKTTLVSPATGTQGIPYFSNGLPFNVTLKWHPIQLALKYVVQLSTSATFATYTEYWANDTSAVITLPDNYNTQYFWRVYAKSEPITLVDGVLDSCKSEISSIFTFKTPYMPVTLSFPDDAGTCVPMIVNAAWVNVPNYQFYRIQVSTSAVFQQDSIVIDIDSIPNEAITLNLPIGIQKYYWRVRVENPSNLGLWSVVRTFESTAETPKDIYPASSSTGIPRNITLEWGKGKINSSFHLIISEKSDFNGVLVDTTLTVNKFSYNFPKFNTKYYWKVMGIYNVCQGAWSDVYNFKTFIAPPTIITPPDDSTGIEPLLIYFKWTGSQGTETYDVDLSADSNFVNLFRFERNILVNQIIYDNLSETKDYWWRVRGKNAEGISDWTPIYHFKTGYIRPTIPQIIFPGSGAYKIPINVLLEWSKPARAQKYHLQFSDKSDFSTKILDLDTITSNTFTVVNLQNNKRYYWRVAAMNLGGSSDFCNTADFLTIPIPPQDTVVLMDPPNGTTKLLTKELVLKWDTIPNSDTYELWVAHDNDFTSMWYSNDKVWTNSKLFFNLEPKTKYFWKVRGTNDGGAGPWSETWTFETEDPASVPFTKLFGTEINPSPVKNFAFIKLSLPSASDLTFEIMDISGNVIYSNEFKDMQSGNNEIEINTQGIVSGVYIYKIKAAGKLEFGKFVVNK